MTTYKRIEGNLSFPPLKTHLWMQVRRAKTLQERKEYFLQVLRDSGQLEIQRPGRKTIFLDRHAIQNEVLKIDIEIERLEKFDLRFSEAQNAFGKVVCEIFDGHKKPSPSNEVTKLFHNLGNQYCIVSNSLKHFNESIINEKRKPLYKAKKLAQETIKKSNTGKSNSPCIAEVTLNGSIHLDNEGLIKAVAIAINNYLQKMTSPSEKITPKGILFHLLPMIRELKKSEIPISIIADFLCEIGFETNPKAINKSLRENPPRQQTPPQD